MSALPHYECLIVSRTPVRVGYPDMAIVDRIVPAGIITWSEELVGVPKATVTVGAENIPTSIGDRFINLAKYPCELWIYRNGVIVHAGPIISLQTSGQVVTIQSSGVLYYLNYMFIQWDYKSTESPFQIARWIINQWQFKVPADAKTYKYFGIPGDPKPREDIDTKYHDYYYNYGINVEHIGTSPDKRNYIANPTTNTGELITITGDYKADQLITVSKAFNDLSAIKSKGFDYYIDLNTTTSDAGDLTPGPGTSRQLMLVNQEDPNDPTERIGRHRDLSKEVSIELRNLKDSRLWDSVAVGDIASWARFLATDDEGDSILTTRENDAEMDDLKAEFGKAGVVGRVPEEFGADSAATAEYTQTALDARRTHALKIGGNSQKASTFALPGASVMDFQPGDYILVEWNPGYGPLQEVREVRQKFVSIDPTGTESFTVQFS